MFANAGLSFSPSYPSSPPGPASGYSYSYSYSPVFSDPGHSFSTSSSSAAPAQPPPPPLPLLHQHQAAAEREDDIFHHLADMGQPSLISEYDLGAEGDLFKAPEPIVEEPLLALDPVAAAISMMSGGEDDNAISASDMGLSEALYECEKELMEESAIEETISELLDVKIPMLQVEDVPGELRASSSSTVAAGECSLQKSVSSGCLNSADWMNGSAARPNFLDFQGLDFEAAFGLRRAYSEGDIQNLGGNTPRPEIAGNAHASGERLVTISDLKSEERKQKLSRYRKKKIERNFGRKIKYACRKALADNQPRVRGRFAKMDDGDMLKPRK
ncbi:GATA transcription factor 20-like [Hordeum vulgare subsp. vulgare]|uniref:CCT domain-containing protein n=2 Tax=Hordeum vulgare subsp. vulgare TaxID=112509 RepID=A0A8I6WP14_HORVV|nr:GATA transcription factor 20-like [Hordeum vulgare subsp. vulgare]